MMNQLEHVIEFFPTGTAEGDLDILDKVFVYANEFSQVIAPPKGSPHLLVGSKGSGKTAVLNFSRRLLDAEQVPNVLLTPFDIDSSDMDMNNSTGDLARAIYETLANAVIVKLSESNSGLFVGDHAKLYNYSVEQGLRSPDTLTRSRKFLAEIAKPFVKIDINTAFPHLTTSTRKEVDAAAARIVGQKGFYLFIDDTDQVARPGVPGHLNRVWALLLAVRRLAYDVENLRAVVSLRTEVWQRMQRDDYGQRDQTDHFKRLIVNMHTDREHVGRIVDRRLSLAAARAAAPVDGYQQFFDGAGARPPTSHAMRLWRDLILVRTRERPRDAIQLVNELARTSINSNLERITEEVFQKIMPPFSKGIAEQFAEEVRPEFPEALEYLRSFAEANYSQGGFTMTAEETRDHFSRMLSRFGGTLYGSTLSQTSKDSVLAIWRFFYQTGVLNARGSDALQPHGYFHLDPADDPYLVTKARWNEVQSFLWEINAVYRDFLIDRKKALSSRTGLATKPHRRRS